MLPSLKIDNIGKEIRYINRLPLSLVMLGFIITGILIIIFLLALLGLGWDTFFSGVKKGADKVGITSIVESAAGGVIEIVENAIRDIIGSPLPMTKQ
jgi:hypothetical protein